MIIDRVRNDVPPEPLHKVEGQLCFAVYSVAHLVGRAYAPLLNALNLTYPQYLVMLVLWDVDDIGVGAIGRRLLLDSGTLTPLLKRLEAAGLVERRRNPSDERQVRVRTTAKGNALREKARALPQAITGAMGRSAVELDSLRDDLLRLRSALEAYLDGDPTSDLRPAL